MIYLDYSANTPVDARVLEQFCAVERRCTGNLSVRSIAVAISSMRTLVLSILINVFIVRVIFVYSLLFIRWRTIVCTVIFLFFTHFAFFWQK